ncbi:5-carboxymethyl-2-hydroxymuconate Delta-isomerase [Castellaniella sp.]|uniref:5-carboxymethyl-2-hydroxymuconate Delta-isomerase n=1 Tax=Castellaniella sp. TaxID=1955812 RepID=UPI00355ED0F0
MPHLTLEYSANLRPLTDIPSLLRKLSQVLVDERADGQPVYPVAGIRVRAEPREAYCIANDRVADAAYVHATLRIGNKRPAQVLQATGDHLFEVLKQHFADLYERQGLALSLVVEEFPPPGAWKHNNLHQRLKD